MESNEPFEALSGELNKEVIEHSKNKKYMKAILISLSKNNLSTPSNIESLNLIGCVLIGLYFISRTILYHEQPYLFWTGLISSLLWVAQLIYSWIGYKKLSLLDLGQDPIVKSIEKISSLLNYYRLQKKIYLWASPFTILALLPIPFFELKGITEKDILPFLNNVTGLTFVTISFTICVLILVFGLNKFWKDKFTTPLESAMQNLKELAE